MANPLHCSGGTGSVGIWGSGPWPVDDRADEAGEVAAELEELGFGALWVSGGQKPGLSIRCRALLDATQRIPVASGILNIWLTSPAEIAASVAELEDAHPGRFLLGLGVSHAPLVERSGQSYTRPYSRMVSWLDELDRAAPTVPVDRRVREHHEAGADHVCVQVLTETGDAFPRAEYRRLAEALLG